ncbi:alpha-L-rhamnosidase C-terminal domain-containing protein [Sphingomonas faeni]|uniref:alpha-L-rhamnosidase C-terminal domain-containing protein n=1 Tax=Sphingomonas faeni TaxID=185950 RepID=UPI003364C47E
MNPVNHYAFGALCAVPYLRIAGAEPIEPGLTRFRVAPVLDPPFASARAIMKSASGPVKVDWPHMPSYRPECHVPSNTTATIDLSGRKIVRGSRTGGIKLLIREYRVKL